MPKDPRKVRTIFDEALTQTGLAARRAFVEEACAGDEDLRQEIDALLAEHDAGSKFLENPVVDLHGLDELPKDDSLTPSPAIDETPGTMIGAYKLLEKIGDGGMGSVWMAEQQHPVRRMVALKLIKAGMHTRQVVARFEAERQALAVMDHPNIAKVHDGGATPAGRPFFVMELVKGTPITKFCDENQLSPRERLGLFVSVCEALQHAHQKGIIHRDIKPSNVLVAPYDGRPVAKVIDFGVAKATGDRLTERTLFTGFGAVIGTLEYMSPEQAEMNNLDIDTRSDVYSLGVLLYELLTGTTPITRQRLGSAALGEALRLIREEDPQRPSTRLSHSTSTLPSIAAQRRMEPARLTKEIRGELDWIVMRALEKDRARRYESASTLARDVERYLQDEPVEACPPSAGYRLRKFVRRNKTGVAAAALVLLTLLGGIAGTSWGMLRAQRERRLAQAAADAERQAKSAAQESETAAREAERDSNEFATFLSNRILGAARPKDGAGGLGVDAKVSAAMDEAASYLNRDLGNRPRVEARARHAYGVMLRVRGDFPKAEQELRRALELAEQSIGVNDAVTLNIRNSLCVVLQMMGRTDELIVLQEQVAKGFEATVGADARVTCNAWHNLAAYISRARTDDARAMKIFQDVYARRKRAVGENHPETILTLVELAELMERNGKPDEGQKLIEDAAAQMERALGPDDGNTLMVTNRVGDYYQRRGKFESAVATFERVLPKERKVLGNQHEVTVNTMGLLAIGYFQVNQPDKAMPLLDEWSAARAKQLGPQSAAFAGELIKATLRLSPLKQHAVAEQLARQSLTILQTAAPDSAAMFEAQGALGESLESQGKNADAEPLLRSAGDGLTPNASTLSQRQRNRLASVLTALLRIYESTGKTSEAEGVRAQLSATSQPATTPARP